MQQSCTVLAVLPNVRRTGVPLSLRLTLRVRILTQPCTRASTSGLRPRPHGPLAGGLREGPARGPPIPAKARPRIGRVTVIARRGSQQPGVSVRWQVIVPTCRRKAQASQASTACQCSTSTVRVGRSPSRTPGGGHGPARRRGTVTVTVTARLDGPGATGSLRFKFKFFNGRPGRDPPGPLPVTRMRQQAMMIV
jgi:hypothetical protein